MTDKFRIDKDGRLVPNTWVSFASNSWYSGNWGDYGGAFYPAAACLGKFGKVYLRGLMTAISQTAFGELIFTLQDGIFTPQKTLIFDVRTSGGGARFEIDLNGEAVISQGGANWETFVSLDGLSYDTRL